jgi:hypothetical protein
MNVRKRVQSDRAPTNLDQLDHAPDGFGKGYKQLEQVTSLYPDGHDPPFEPHPSQGRER